MSDLVWTLHTVSGVVARVPAHLLDHPVLGEYLIEVDPHTKSYQPDLWKPTTASDYKAARASAPEVVDSAPDSEHEE